MIKKKTGAVSISGILILTLCACWGFSVCATAKKEQTLLKPSGIAVKVAKVGKADIPQNVQSLGSLEAVQKVVISAEDAGRVTALNFNSGQQVIKGMPIATLDDSRAKAAYQSAVTALKVVTSKYNRSKLLLNQAISQQEVDQLSADVEAAKANVQQAQSILDSKTVTAPFNGVLGTVKVQVGDYVNVGDPVVEIVNIQQLRVEYNISESELPKLKIGQLAQVSVEAYPQKVFYGTVSYISPIVNTDTRAVNVQAVINNDNGLLSPGMYVQVKQETSVAKNAMVLPEQAVQVDIKGYYVYLVKGDHVYQTYIKIGERRRDLVQILSGIKLGDSVVSEGQQKLNDGSLIRIVD